MTGLVRGVSAQNFFLGGVTSDRRGTMYLVNEGQLEGLKIMKILRYARSLDRIADGSGWVRCADGAWRYGLHGSAGIVLIAPSSRGPVVLLQQREAASVDEGGAWGCPGGARSAGESAQTTAIRELMEETGATDSDLAGMEIVGEMEFNPGGWTYTTVIAMLPRPFVAIPDIESDALSWVPVSQVRRMNLHKGFRKTWKSIYTRITSGK